MRTIAKIFGVAILLFVVLVRTPLFSRDGKTELHIVAEEVPCIAPGCFEAIAHYSALYDGDKRIDRVGEYDISPSGDYAVYVVYNEDDAKIMLYKRGSEKPKDVTDGEYAPPQSFTWDEENLVLTIVYTKDNPNPKYNKHSDSNIDFSKLWPS